MQTEDKNNVQFYRMRKVYSFEYPSENEAEIYESIFSGRVPQFSPIPQSINSSKIQRTTLNVLSKRFFNFIKEVVWSTNSDYQDWGVTIFLSVPEKPLYVYVLTESYDYYPCTKLVKVQLEKEPEWVNSVLSEYILVWDSSDDLTHWF